MKRLSTLIATVTFMLNLGGAASYAQTLNLTISGTAAPSTVDLGTGTGTSEYNLAANGGSFTFRTVSSPAPTAQPSTTCSGATKLYIPIAAGMGVLRSPDGSLLQLKITGGSDCIDFAAGHALCIRIYEVIGGTGRFQDASAPGDAVTLTMTVTPVVPGKFVFFFVTGEITGRIS